MALLYSKRKFSSWVNLGRSDEPDLQDKLEGAQMHPSHTNTCLESITSCDGNCKVLGLPPCHFKCPWKRHRIKRTSIHARTAQRYFTGLASLHLHTTAVLDLPKNSPQQSQVWNLFPQHWALQKCRPIAR